MKYRIEFKALIGKGLVGIANAVVRKGYNGDKQ
jgi:hypothetical protein